MHTIFDVYIRYVIMWVRVTWHMYSTHSYMWRDSCKYTWHVSFICVTCLIHMCDTQGWHDMRTRHIHTCDRTHLYVWHDSSVCVTRHDSFIYVTRHIWHMSIRHVTYTNASCHAYKCVMSHIWMRHVPHMNESRHTCQCIMSRTWIRQVTHMNASCEYVMSHIWIRHVTHKYVMSRLWMRHVTHMNVSRVFWGVSCMRKGLGCRVGFRM